MRQLSKYVLAAAFLPVWACAGAQSEDSGDGSGGTTSAVGGTSHTGGSSSHTGGSSSHAGGSSSHTGGSSSHTGGTTGSGGVTINPNSTGGAESSGGATSTGGAASGGSGSGGAGSGGGPGYEGDCADKPTLAEWKATSGRAIGDTVIFVCSIQQQACTLEMIGEPYLFECTTHHLPNCEAQDPTAGSWTVIDSCANLVGFGGMGGMGGAP